MKSIAARYFIAILPPADISDRVRKWQEELSESYDTSASLRSPPHITLHMPFLWKESREQELIAGLEKHFQEQSLFTITLEGIGAFAPRVIYINVKLTDALVGCHKGLTKFCKVNFNVHNSAYREEPYHPHMTLAFRDLKKSDFHRAWDAFRDRQFNEEFEVAQVTLLKHTGKEWLAHRSAELS